jgi:polysaccharide deacetylase 2 family uncharacterized protein YibQ
VARKKSGTPHTVFVLLGLCALGVALWITGCGKIASKFRSLTKSHPSKKERASAQAPQHATAGPRLAIILDDLGSDRGAVEAVFALHEPLTVSVLPFHAHSTEIAEEAKSRGYEVMLHLPMQPVGNEKPEAQQLYEGMSESDLTHVLDGMLKSVPTATGVNNHEGSLATTDEKLMMELMVLLKQRGLLFIDSRTTAATVAFESAEKAGVRCGFRNVPFLDDVQDVTAIKKQLELALSGAKEKGSAIAIGHPHAETLEALKEMLPRAEEQGVHLVFVSEVVR